MKLSDHPAAVARTKRKPPLHPTSCAAGELREMALAAGADDAGIVDVGRESIAHCRQDLQQVLPDVRTIVVMAFRVNPHNLRSLAQSVTDHEFIQGFRSVAGTGRTLARRLMEKGVKAVHMPVGFPQEASRWPGKTWLTEEKRFAEEAGLGKMGYNRLVIHPEFGAGVLLGSVLVAAECDRGDRPLDPEFNPCIGCGLCVRVCPTGAVRSDGGFDFLACLTHNYRERLGGFQNWVEQVAASAGAEDYRKRVSDRETVSMWQHLAVGPQNKCDRCMAVCPAGSHMIGEFLKDRKGFIASHVNRFRDLPEDIYAVKGTAADLYVKKHFPHKRVVHVSNGVRPASVAGFLDSLPLAFQPHRAGGLDAVFHFSFTGEEVLTATVAVKEKEISVCRGLDGNADLHVMADSRTWLRFLNRETGLVSALVRRKIRLRGRVGLMTAFGRCFPS